MIKWRMLCDMFMEIKRSMSETKQRFQ